MISKFKCGAISAFLACCRYVTNVKKQAQILASQGVRTLDFKSMANDFIMYAEQRPNKSSSVLAHCILSFPQGEKINDELARKIAIKYLDQLGFQNSPYVIVTHSNTDHFHIHCITSFVSLNNEIVSDSWIGLRGKKVAQKLTQEFNLIPAIKKDFTKTNFSNLRNHDKEKYRLYAIISHAKKHAHSFEQFQKMLIEKGIETKLKYKRGSDQIQGISFKSTSGEFCFKGSEIDRNFSYLKLIQSIENNKVHDTKYAAIDEIKSENSPGFNTESTSSVPVISGIFGESHSKSPADDDEFKKKNKKKYVYRSYN